MMFQSPGWYDSKDNPHSARLRSSSVHNSARVWIADDDEDMRTLLSAALQRDGYDVTETKDGRETMQHIRQAFDFPMRLPDLIVMDVLMPHYSGLGVLMELRRARWFTPVIIMTAFPDDVVVQRAKDLGAIAVFKKPFNMDSLRTAVLNASLLNAHARANSSVYPDESKDGWVDSQRGMWES